MKKKPSVPLYDAKLIRDEMYLQEKSARQIAEMKQEGLPKISTQVITNIRAGRNVKVSTLKAACAALGLELTIIKRPAV